MGQAHGHRFQHLQRKIKCNSEYFSTTGLSNWTGITTCFNGMRFGDFRYVPKRVLIEKIMLIIHIRNMDINTLARRVYEEQKVKKLPGLATETASSCQVLGNDECSLTTLSKALYIQILVKACHSKK